MVQLWLTKGEDRRIDTIAQLRTLFSSAEGNEQQRLCREMFKRLQSGILRGWLEQQVECCCLAKDAYDCRKGFFGGEANSVTDESRAEAMAWLCKIPVEVAKLAIEESRSSDNDRKRQLVQAQSWYADNSKVRAFFANVNWDYVATDSVHLNRILEMAAREAGSSSGVSVTRIYICNVLSEVGGGAVFMLPSPEHLKNLRLTGFGQPIVWFHPRYGGEFDMLAAHVSMEGVDLNPQNIHVKNERVSKEVVDVQ